jgi:16S rRNA processing protein RimM
MQEDPQWTMLARILRPQGRKGEVLADLLTDFPDRFTERPQVHLAPAGFSEAGEAQAESALQQIQILSHWQPTGRNAGRIVLHFAGVDSITQAEALAGKEVVVPSSERMPLDEDAAYISDLTGCTVYDHGATLGTVEAVQFLTTPDGSRRLEEAAPLLVVSSEDGSELLVPFVKSYLIAIDTAAKTIHMKLPEGLADLNRGGGSSG